MPNVSFPVEYNSEFWNFPFFSEFFLAKKIAFLLQTYLFKEKKSWKIEFDFPENIKAAHETFIED